MTCVAPARDFSVVSVVAEGPSRLGCHRRDGGGKMGMLTCGAEQGAGSIRSGPCAAVARGHS